jgi:hypothetical protein
MGALRRATLEQVSFRPQPERHNAWELVVHAAYWKYRICAAIADLPRGSFDLKGSNFFERSGDGDDAAWRRDLDLLTRWHERLIEAVRDFNPERLGDPIGDGRFTYEALLDGAGAHDVYHAGQIRLLMRMWDGRTT